MENKRITSTMEFSRTDRRNVRDECKRYNVRVLKVEYISASKWPLYTITAIEGNLRRWYKEWYWDGDTKGQVTFEQMFGE